MSMSTAVEVDLFRTGRVEESWNSRSSAFNRVSTDSFNLCRTPLPVNICGMKVIIHLFNDLMPRCATFQLKFNCERKMA